MEPYANLKQVAEEAGFSSQIISGMLKRLKAQHQPVARELKNLTTSKMIQQLNEKIGMALEYMDDFSFSNASLRDLTIGLGILIEKKQLLSGEPTQILSVEERKNINELLPYLIKETNRRGITIEHVPGEPVRTILPAEVQEQQINATARRIKKEEIEPNL